jgi:hypothetical protein
LKHNLYLQGKFGQRAGLLSTDYYTNQDVYFDLVFDPSVEVHSVQIINPQMVCVQHRKTDEFIEDASNTNVIVAAWVTAQARLKLYEYLEQLDNRVLYMDTGELHGFFVDFLSHSLLFSSFKFMKHTPL